jgi:hypothetical protein
VKCPGVDRTDDPRQTLLHKIEKTLMLETDVSETVNEMILSVRKMGRIGLIAVYSGFTNHFNSEFVGVVIRGRC